MDWYFDNQGSVLGDWPRDAAGTPVAPAFLEHIFGNETELAMERNMLASYGIPTVCRYPGDGTLGKVVLGVSGYGLDIYVPETMLEDARNILSCDLSEADIPGEPEDGTNPEITNTGSDIINTQEEGEQE